MNDLSCPNYNPVSKLGHEIRGLLQILSARLQLITETTEEPLTRTTAERTLQMCLEASEQFGVLLDESLPMKTPPLRCLVAEDQSDTQEYLIRTLKKHGHTVVGAATKGTEMYKMALELKPNVVVFDIYLAPNVEGESQSNGLDVLAEIVKVIPDIMGVAITGSQDYSLVMKATEEWVFNYLLKPISDLQLIAALNVAYGRWSQFQGLKEELDAQTELLARAKLVMQAKHVIMRQNGWSEDRAYKYLQRVAKARRIKMVELAQEILEPK